MKKRIVCVLLTLIMLLGLVPMGASAASHEVSAAAITVLKQMTTYKNTCYYFTGSEFRTGYGTVCEEKHAFGTDGKPIEKTEMVNGKEVKYYDHTISQANADAALRKALKELDKKVNAFASANGLSLSQNQHDALVVFSYNAGSGWMDGNGVVKTVIVNGGTGNELLNAMAKWTNNANIERRKVEVNMYMNGVYSNTTSTNYIAITYHAKEYDTQEVGNIAQGAPYRMYYDAVGTQAHVPVATHSSKRFIGWYTENGVWLPVVHSGLRHNTDSGVNLYPRFLAVGQIRDVADYTLDVNYIYPKTVYKGDLKTANTDQQKLINGKTQVTVLEEALDRNGTHWCKIGTDAWVAVTTSATGYVNETTPDTINWTVTVTSNYVNRRKNATTTSAKNGSYNMGTKLGIIQEDDGWLQVGEVQADGSVKAVGWVYSIYTDWGSVYDSGNTAPSNTVVATATVTFNGYLNIRQEPGTDGKIVGALAKSDTVEIFEVKTVNGHKWGRCKAGWICLTYTSQRDITTSAVSDAGLKLYAFTGNTKTTVTPRVAAGDFNNPVQIQDYKDVTKSLDISTDEDFTLTNLVVVEGKTWGKATWSNAETAWLDKDKGTTQTIRNTRSGWIELDPNEVLLDAVKYTVVADSVNVRDNWGDAAGLLFTLNKGVEVEVNLVALVGENIWGRIVATNDFQGSSSTGYVNLASKYFTRDGLPVIEEEAGDPDTGKMATVINTDSLRVRKTGATYGTQIGSLARGAVVAVWEYKDGWYKVDSNQNGTYDYDGDGWCSEQYLDVYAGSATNSTVTDAAGNAYTTDGTGKGIVANTYAGVNVRQGAGTNYATNGKLLPGTVVEILETARGGKWGRTAQGWVSMDYITMVTYNQVVENTTPNGGTTVESYDKAEKTTTTAVYTGNIVADTEVYRTPTKDQNKIEKIRNASYGENVTIYELAKVTENITSEETDGTDSQGNTTTTTTTITTTTYWARINDGWVQNPETTIALNALDEKIHTQTDTATLKVRTAPETGDVFDALAQGDQVSVTALEIRKDKVWGRVETDEGTGWVRLDYMSEGAVYVQAPVQNNTTTTPTQPQMGIGSSTGGYVTNASGYRYTGKVINAKEVNVRATPSTAADKTTTLTSGQALVIYETTIAENMAWGRCDAGWVYLYYVDLIPVVNGAVDARVVYNDNTIIYSDVNGSSVVGTYSRMSTIDIYEIVGKMARTDQGWVNTDNLL